MDDLPPMPDLLGGLISRRTWRVMREAHEDSQWSLRRGARNRQIFFHRVINARTRWLEIHYPDRSRVWHITPGHPGGAWSDTGHELDPPQRHTPTVLQRDDDRGRTEYRGACLSCRWESDEHTGTRRTALAAAVEAAHDHAFPGWRTLPYAPRAVIEEPDGPAARHLAALYPPGWWDAGAPLLTTRTRAHDEHRYPYHRRPRYRLNLPAPSGSRRKRQPAPEPTATLF